MESWTKENDAIYSEKEKGVYLKGVSALGLGEGGGGGGDLTAWIAWVDYTETKQTVLRNYFSYDAHEG